MRISGGISGGNGKGGRTQNEVYEGRNPGNENPRFEPRSRLIRGSPCTKPEEKRGLAPEEHSDEVPVPLFPADYDNSVLKWIYRYCDTICYLEV